MKPQNILGSIAAAALVFTATGCGKNEPAAGEAATSTAEGAGDALTKAAAAVKDKVGEIAAPVSAKAQELIASARQLVSEGKFQEALAKLNAIGSEQLSPDQQSIVDGLKEQIARALNTSSKATSDAKEAAGNLLKQ